MVQRLQSLMLQSIDARSWGLYFTVPTVEVPPFPKDVFILRLGSECGFAIKIIEDFLEDPESFETIDFMCGSLVSGFNPLMIPFSSKALNLSSAAPAEWIEQQPGVSYSSPNSRDSLLFSRLVQEQAGSGEPLEQTDTIITNGLVWRIYQAVLKDEELVIHLALTEVDGTVYSMKLISEWATTGRSYETIFIPLVKRTTIP